MTTQFSFSCPDQKGELAKFANCLSNEGINITGLGAWTHNGEAFVSFITDNSEKTSSCLKNAGFSCKQKEAVCISLKNQPGALYDFTNKLSSAGVNIESFFVTVNGEEIICTNNPEQTRTIANQLGIYREFAGQKA